MHYHARHATVNFYYSTILSSTCNLSFLMHCHARLATVNFYYSTILSSACNLSSLIHCYACLATSPTYYLNIFEGWHFVAWQLCQVCTQLYMTSKGIIHIVLALCRWRSSCSISSQVVQVLPIHMLLYIGDMYSLLCFHYIIVSCFRPRSVFPITTLQKQTCTRSFP